MISSSLFSCKELMDICNWFNMKDTTENAGP